MLLRISIVALISTLFQAKSPLKDLFLLVVVVHSHDFSLTDSVRIVSLDQLGLHDMILEKQGKGIFLIFILTQM